MRNIQTIDQLHELQWETCRYAAIVVVVIFFVAFIIANIIPYQGGNDRSYITRRIWWFISLFLGSVGFFLYNLWYVMSFIKKAALQNQFFRTIWLCSLCTFLFALVISLIVMIVFRHSKFGSILGKEKNA